MTGGGGLFAYRASLRPELADFPWHALIFAAMRRADTMNAARLKGAFPGLWAEFEQRYDSPAGVLPGE